MENQEVKKSKRFKTIDIAYIGIFAALIAVCSWISIPLAVPVTLQTMAVCITAGLLGTKKSCCLYITRFNRSACFCGLFVRCRRAFRYDRRIYYRLYFYSFNCWHNAQSAWKKDLGLCSFNGYRHCCLLCFRNCMVCYL